MTLYNIVQHLTNLLKWLIVNNRVNHNFEFNAQRFGWLHEKHKTFPTLVQNRHCDF